MAMSFSNISNTVWDGNFSKTDKNGIGISQQTYEGLKITVSSITTDSKFFYIKSDTLIQIFLGL